jgi:superfamily II DNA/RNA helicase
VIRARTDRINIEYKVVKCEEQVIEETVVKECQDAAAGFRPHIDKGIVYCRTRWQCERLAEILQCGAYHSQIDNQVEVFTEWQNNEQQVFIVATGALGVGVDIANIRIVIHMGLPYGMIDFAQESGRAGRDGKPAKAVVVVQPDAKMPDWSISEDEVAIEEFINTKECRRVVMGQFLDGQGRECMVIAGIECDNCMMARQVESEGVTAQTSQIESEDEYNLDWIEEDEEIMQPLQKYVQQEAKSIQGLEKKLKRLQEVCPPCLILYGAHSAQHLFRRCQKTDGLTWGDYMNFNREMVYEKFSCCFRCGVPQIICQEYIGKNICRYRDLIIPTCMALWRTVKGQRQIENMVKISLHDKNQFREWLGKKQRLYDVEMTNAVILLDKCLDESNM